MVAIWLVPVTENEVGDLNGSIIIPEGAKNTTNKNERITERE